MKKLLSFVAVMAVAIPMVASATFYFLAPEDNNLETDTDERLVPIGKPTGLISLTSGGTCDDLTGFTTGSYNGVMYVAIDQAAGGSDSRLGTAFFETDLEPAKGQKLTSIGGGSTCSQSGITYEAFSAAAE